MKNIWSMYIALNGKYCLDYMRKKKQQLLNKKEGILD